MPLHAPRPIVRVEHSSMRTLETVPENLFGLWTVFSRCSPAMEDGKRYENLAWRLWSRETLCCQPEHSMPARWQFERHLSTTESVPDLSSSVASDDSTRSGSESAITTTTRSTSSSRPDLRRNDSTNSQARSKHITPIDLEHFVNSIQEKQAIEPLSPLPAQLAQLAPPAQVEEPQKPTEITTPRPSSPPPTARFIPESSTSTVATAIGSDGMSPPVGSDVSSSTEMSTHSVVHGFSPNHISTSARSSTNLNPTPILKPVTAMRPTPSRTEPARKKAPVFMLGGSSEEDNSSSLEAYGSFHTKRSSLSDNLRRPAAIRKTTSFKNEISTRTIQDATSEESEEAIESDSEDDSDDNAIEEEDSDEEWEDDNEDSVAASVDNRQMFQRVDSKPNLVSRRSLLTTALHQGDRAQALQNAASRSSPAIRRSRTSTPNGPSTGNSPQEDSGLMMPQRASRAKPIIMTTSNVHPPALSPRTTRRNMLQTELTQSLRQNLLWERQQKNATTNAYNKRMPAPGGMRRAMTTNDIKGMATSIANMNKSGVYKDESKPAASLNEEVFDAGLQEYHTKGW